MIRLENITLQISSKVLLENASAQIEDGHKIGIIGHNGCGKTTLFRVLKQELDVFQGEVIYSSRNKIASAEQEIKEDDLAKPILEYVKGKDKYLTYLLEKEKTATPIELPEVMEELRLYEADSADARTSEILIGLGFNQEDLKRPVRDFSGGWQMRLNLAGALFQISDILLLDEPTNHLDLEAIIWLESYLKKSKKTILLISHDQDFINNICTEILHFENKKLVRYMGNYDDFVRLYKEKIELNKKAIKKQEDKKAHLQSYIDRFRYKATKAKQAQSRIKMLEKMENISEIVQDKQSIFNFATIKPLASPLIVLEDASVGYDKTPVLTKLNLSIGQDDRIALLGKNGNGKSTLVKLISNHLPLMGGTIRKSPKLKIGYFNQNQAEELPLDKTPEAYIKSLNPDKENHKIRSFLSQFGLEQEKAITPIAELSGGEKTRLLFAKISLDCPELLILDEPTNHLDILGRNALVEALNNYNGALIIISHDFHLLRAVADDLWLVNLKTCKPFDGDLNNYRDFLLKKEEKLKEKKEITSPNTSSIQAKKIDKLSRKDRVSIREIEKNLTRLEQEKADIIAKFAIVSGSKVQELQISLHQLEEKIKLLEEEWLKLSE